jgi:ABC-2 type transport system ATP-binding protein
VLVLDEPFNYLDPSSQIIVAELLKQMNERQGTTVVVSSHNLAYITDVATRILLLEKGKIIKDVPNRNGSALDELKSYFASTE